MRLTMTLAAFATLTLAACGAPADEADDETAPAASGTSQPVESGAAPVSAPPADANSIPIAIRGRWGLVAADCTSTRGDAKGLIDISEKQIRFYESVATLTEVENHAPDSIRAEWSFIGEGSTWTRDMALTVQNGGDKLERREYGEGAMDGVLTYTKCG